MKTNKHTKHYVKSVLTYEFKGNWYRYVIASKKRLVVFILIMFIPVINFVILLNAVPYKWGRKIRAAFFMDKADSHDVLSAFWFTFGVAGFDYLLYLIVRVSYNLF